MNVQEFVSAFEALLRANSIRSVGVYRVSSVEYLDERIDGLQGRVLTSVDTKEAVTEMEYRFRRLVGGWKVVDYSIDGLWAAQNYRSQFQKILKQHGWSELLARMARRARELETDR